MRRTLLALTTAVTLVPSPAGAACGIGDPRGDATVADGHVLDGAYDRPAPGPAVDLVSAWVDVGARFTTFTVHVADLATAVADSPSGVSYSWEAETRDRVVFVVAWSTPTGSAVEVYAGRTLGDATWVARASGPVVDVANDRVTFALASQTIGIRAGTPVASTVRSYRQVALDVPGKTVAQSAAADHATRRAKPWGRC